MFDQITIDRILLLHPSIRDRVKDWYLEINKQLPKGVRLRFTHTYRSIEEQNALFNQKPKVTNAKGGQSLHNYGLAFDIVILKEDINGKWVADWKVDKHWLKVVEYFKSKGFVWGGDFKSIIDPPHFEWNLGKTWKHFQVQPTLLDNNRRYPVI